MPSGAGNCGFLGILFDRQQGPSFQLFTPVTPLQQYPNNSFSLTLTFVTVAVITALCFVFASTRKYGVIGTGLLLYFQPFFTVGVLAVAGIIYFFYRRNFA